jgi:hypothetical protein
MRKGARLGLEATVGCAGMKANFEQGVSRRLGQIHNSVTRILPARGCLQAPHSTEITVPV